MRTSTGLLTGRPIGFGIAVLPCIVADAGPGLDPLPSAARGPPSCAVAGHPRTRSPRPAVRAVIDFLYERLMRHVRQLEEKQAAA